MIRMRLPLSIALAAAAGWSLGSTAFAAQDAETPPAETPAAEQPESEPAAEEPTEEPASQEKPAEEPATEEKPAEEKPAEEPAKEEKPAEEKPADDAKKIDTVPLVTNLDNPSGLAVHGKTGDVFVASRYGVYRYQPKNHGVSIEVAGYPTDVYGKGPKYDIGPLGVDFLDDWLIVGDGSRPDGEEVVRVYKVEEAPRKEPLAEDKAELTLGPIPEGYDTAGGEKTTKPEGNFYDVAVGKSAIFVSSNGDDTKGWIHKAAIQDGKPQKLVPTIATKMDVQTDAPVPLAFGKDKAELFVGQMGEINVPGDALLLVYDPESGELKRKYELGLSDPAGMDFSPKTGKLYVTDFAWAKPEDGGLFEVTIEGDAVTTKKVLSLDKPTAIAFDADGKLYVTVIGTVDENAKTKAGEQLSPGKLLMIDAGL